MIFFLAALIACQSVEGDRLTGRDLAAANPAFSAIDPAFDLGPAPLPGLKRLLRAADLQRIATRAGIALNGPAGEACFERPANATRATAAAPRVKLAPDINRGDRVQVEVSAGGARLAFETQAESSGHISETIIVRNPESGKLFRARVEAPGKVSVKK